jgi:hypothetical protein
MQTGNSCWGHNTMPTADAGYAAKAEAHSYTHVHTPARTHTQNRSRIQSQHGSHVTCNAHSKVDSHHMGSLRQHHPAWHPQDVTAALTAGLVSSQSRWQTCRSISMQWESRVTVLEEQARMEVNNSPQPSPADAYASLGSVLLYSPPNEDASTEAA